MKDFNHITQIGKLFDGRYKLLRPLSSEGGTADVWLALDTNTIDEVFDETTNDVTSLEETGIKVAIKIYRPKNALDIGEQRFREEFKIVFNCHHTNLVQPINFSISDGLPYLVLPYCKNGSSENLQGKLKSKEDIWKYIADVSAGLAYLHAFNPTIVHHDIKPANILIDDNKNYAITDFGISSHRGFNREGYDDNHSGTMAYMAPERFKEDYESIPESDIWSLGATLYELVSGKVPFGEEGGLEQLQSGKPIPALPQSVPNDIKNLINDCLSPDISKRPTASDIHRAASLKTYPIKNKIKYYIAGGFIAIAAVVCLVIFLLPKPTITEVIPTVSDEEKFSQAMTLVNSNDPEYLKNGLSILDTLGNNGFIPALYEQAHTYGWYSDSVSVTRKQLLGIDIFPQGSPEAFLPKSHLINAKAIGLFTRIEELKDSDYAEINGNALYRLACYYVNSNNMFKRDINRAKSLLQQSQYWAKECNDTTLLRRIENGLNTLK